MASSLEDLSAGTRDELALLARDLSESPKTRKAFLALTRQIKPDMPMPELDIEDRLSAAEAAAAERISKLEAQLSEKDMRSELDRRRKKLIDEGKAEGPEDIEAIEKLMLERGIQSHDTAADYFEWMKQAAAPTPPAYNRNVIDANTRTQLKDYWRNPVTAARDEAQRAFTDFRKNPRVAG